MNRDAGAAGGIAAWWRRRGIRARSTITAAVAVGLAVLVVGGALLVVLRTGVEASIRNATELRARDFAAQAATDDRDALSAAIQSPSDDGTLIQIIDGTGQVTAASPSLAGHGPLVPPGEPGSHSTHIVTSGMPDPGDYVVASLTTTSVSGPVTVVAAASLDQRDRVVAAVLAGLAVGGPFILLAVALTTWIAVGRSLASVDHIRDEVEDIEATSLSRRVPVPQPADEVRRLAVTMNEMLDRLQASMDAQRRFVSDASHELKSPLATLKTTVEVSRRTAEGLDGHVTEVLEQEIDRMSRLVADLLLLARADEGALAPPHHDVDMDDIAANEAARLRALGFRVETNLRPVRVTGDRAGLERVARNLADNAARFAHARVVVSTDRTGGSAVLTVEDDGPGIPVEQREAVFDRFVRLDEHRSRQAGGTGLGLAIVRDIVAAHAGTVAADDSPLGGARLTVRMPAQADVQVDSA